MHAVSGSTAGTQLFSKRCDLCCRKDRTCMPYLAAQQAHNCCNKRGDLCCRKDKTSMLYLAAQQSHNCVVTCVAERTKHACRIWQHSRHTIVQQVL